MSHTVLLFTFYTAVKYPPKVLASKCKKICEEITIQVLVAGISCVYVQGNIMLMSFETIICNYYLLINSTCVLMFSLLYMPILMLNEVLFYSTNVLNLFYFFLEGWMP